MNHLGMMDAICPRCGDVIRVRAHSRECFEEEVPLDEKLGDAAALLSDAYRHWWFSTREIRDATRSKAERLMYDDRSPSPCVAHESDVRALPGEPNNDPEDEL